MKISIITVVHNGEKYIEDCIKSVLGQTYPNIEYIVVDGNSKDRTLEIIDRYRDRISTIISEPDRGIYDAMNKGISAARGDVIGFLNADDVYTRNDVLESVARNFKQSDIDALYGDVVYVAPENMEKPVRYYSSKGFTPNLFSYGFMPAHPTFYAKRSLYGKYGLFKPDYRIAADFELVMRFMLRGNLKTAYLQMPFVKMRTGGSSTKNFKSNIIINQEIKRACAENGVSTNYLKIYSKYAIKLFQLFRAGR